MSKLFVQDRYVVKMINWKINEFIFKNHIQLLCKRGTAVNPTQNLPVQSAKYYARTVNIKAYSGWRVATDRKY